MRRPRAWIASEWRRVVGLRERAPRDERMNEEFRFHLEMLTERNLRRGMTMDEARRAANVEFGGTERFSESARDEYRSRPLEDFVRDVRHAVRNLAHMPAFTIAALLTLALGVGATTVMYSIVDHVVLRPLPYADADELSSVRVVVREISDQVPTLGANPAHFLTWRERCTLCEDVGVLSATAVTWTGEDEPRQLDGVRVSWSLLSMLGAQAAHGRLFREDEEAAASNVVVLSDAFWRRELGGDPGVIGRTLLLDSRPREIIGVLPAGFRLPKRDELGERTGFPDDPDVFVPLAIPDWQLRSHGGFDYSVIVRHAPDVRTGDVEAHLASLEPSVTEITGPGMTITPVVTPLHDQVVGGSRAGLLLLLAAVGAVLLLVCVNLASLLLARNAGHAREAAVRVALGAGRGRLVRESLTESLVLALGAGVLGLLLARAGLTALLRVAPPDLPRLHEVQFDIRIAAAGVALSVLTGVLFGVLPALRMGGANPGDALRSGGRTQSRSRAAARAQAALIATQVALTSVLLVAAGLLLSSFARVLDVDRGYRVQSALVLDVVAPRTAFAETNGIQRVYGDLIDRLARVPGVESVAAASRLPLDGLLWADGMSVENDVRPSEEWPIGNFHFVTPGYFNTLDIPVRGEAFTELDGGRSVTVLSAHAARLLFPDGTDPIGRRVQLGDRVLAEVIGVAADIPATRLGDEPASIAYLPPWSPLSFPLNASIVLRTDVDPQSIAAMARAAIREANGAVAIDRVRTLDQMVHEVTAARRFQLSLLLLFAITALVTACVGIYGVAAHTLAGRRNEIGVRMALGAHRARILRLVVGQGLMAAGIGLLAGLVAAIAVGRVIRSLLFGVGAADPTVLAAVATLLLLVTATATWIPARRVARQDLAGTLRD